MSNDKPSRRWVCRCGRKRTTTNTHPFCCRVPMALIPIKEKKESPPRTLVVTPVELEVLRQNKDFHPSRAKEGS